MNKKFYFLLIAFTVLAITATYGQAVNDKFNAGNLYYVITSLSPAEVKLAPSDVYRWHPSLKPTGIVTVPGQVNYNGTDYKVTSIGNYALNECEGVTAVNLPEGIHTIGIESFFQCNNIEGVFTLPKMLKTLGNRAFLGCTKITGFEIDASNGDFTTLDGVLYNKEKTALAAFPAGKSFATHTIPETTTKVNPYVFKNFVFPENKVVIPAHIQYFDEASFHSTNLIRIEFKSSVATFGPAAFGGIDANCEVIVPVGTDLDEFKTRITGNYGAPSTITVKHATSTGIKSFEQLGVVVRGGKGTITIEAPQPPKGGAIERIASIYNVSGALVRTVALSGGQTFLSVKIPAGTYLVKIDNAAEKVIVQ